MRYLIILTIFTLGLVTACQQASTQTPGRMTNQTAKNVKTSPTAPPHAEDEAQRISLKDAKAAYDSGNALFIDTRPESAYKGEHIKDAINIPAGETDKHIAELPKNKQLIFYCS
ncbi:MAG TPA: rhodanese-like domain-containing protein [Pyrinomonadaceae bacterium]|jgi:3-mercaptopyruvate sulfurtransferase SseA|nr:rhodanese-like domain-containing protein [Pyrinomonadaceae bacterium]